jgi:hypothetical protein
MAKRILTRKWWQSWLEQRSQWRKLEVKWELVLTVIWISLRFYKCLEIIQVDRDLVEWAQILFSNCSWQLLKLDMIMTIQMKLKEKVMNLDQTTLLMKELGLANSTLIMFISQAFRWTKTQSRDQKKGKKESHHQELMVQVLVQAISLEAGQPKDRPPRKRKNEETVSEDLLKRMMMKMLLRMWSQEGIKENLMIDRRLATIHSLGIWDLNRSRLLQTWDPVACRQWIKATWPIAMLRTRISQLGSIWALLPWMNDLIEEWESMNKLVQEEEIVEEAVEGLKTQSQIVFRASWANLTLDPEIFSVDHNPLVLVARATLEQINFQNQQKAKSKH